MRPRVQRAPGLPCVPLGIALRPLTFWGETNLQTSGECCRENAEVRSECSPHERSDMRVLVAIASPDVAPLIRATFAVMPAQAGIQYSERATTEAGTRGVLDTRLRGYDDGG
jgi:hypothetical protein